MNMKKKNPAHNILGLPLCTIDGEKGVFILRTMILPRDCQSAIMDYLEGRSETLDAVPFYRGGLLLEVFTSKDKSRILARLCEFPPEGFTPISGLEEITAAQLQQLEALSRK